MSLRLWIFLSLAVFVSCASIETESSHSFPKETKIGQPEKGPDPSPKIDTSKESPRISDTPVSDSQPSCTPDTPVSISKEERSYAPPKSEKKDQALSMPPSETDIPCLYHENETLSGSGILPQQARVKLRLPKNAKSFFYQRSARGEIKELEGYRGLSKDEMEISLKDIPEDTDWLLVTGEGSPEKISQSVSRWMPEAVSTPPAIAMRGLKMAPKETDVHTRLSKRWRLYSAASSAFESPRLLAQIDILLLPFHLMLGIQRDGNPGFRNFLHETESVHENDRIQMRLKAYKPVYLTVFLCDSAGNRYKLFPQDGERAQKMSPSEGEIFLPSEEDGFVFDATEGTEYICCFYDDHAFSSAPLQKWLEMADLKKHIFRPGLRGGRAIALPPPTDVYVVGFKHEK